MIASKLASNILRPLKESDSVDAGLQWLQEFKLEHAPVVKGDQYLGLISEEALIEERDGATPIVSVLKLQDNLYVYEGTHVYDVLTLANRYKLTILPVVDANLNYKGIITMPSLLEATSTIFSLATTGGIIVLEISNVNNSLAYISQIVESENAQVLSSYVQNFPDSTKLEVTLKINRVDISSIVAAFNRYNYTVVGVYNTTNNSINSGDRFDSLMNYLNV